MFYKLVQSMFYKLYCSESSPCFTNEFSPGFTSPVQSRFYNMPKQTHLCVETLKTRLAGWSRQYIMNFRLVSKLIYSNRQE